MKRLVFLKGLFLSCFVAALFMLPSSLNAQKNDVFFRVQNDDIYNDREGDGFNITNYGIGEPVPVGSGLLILALTGAGYAVARRRRTLKSHKGAALLLAFALLLGMTQCKKNVEQIATNDLEPANGLLITLRVDNTSKVDVEPEGTSHPDWATVNFENGDRVYVANNGKYCGYLDYQNGAFTGTIDVNPEYRSVNDYLHFYFMGNKTPSVNPSINNGSGFDVDIIDQTEKYPVISYAHSTRLYAEGKTDYVARLQNYCAIVKFTTNKATTDLVELNGVNNKVTINFNAFSNGQAVEGYKPYSYGKMTVTGKLKLHSESPTVKWAIMLPQAEPNTVVAVAEKYASQDYLDMPAITENAYIKDPVAINFISVFTVDHEGSLPIKAIFAPGNLQYQPSTSKWQFAENQWDYIGADNSNINNASYQGWLDLFGWGTGLNPTNYSASESSYDNNYHDWGAVNSIWDGDKKYAAGFWSTPHSSYYLTLMSTRKLDITVGNTTTSQCGWGPATVNGVKGIIFFPDDWNGSLCESFVYPYRVSATWYNYAFTLNQFAETETVNNYRGSWSVLENAGCVFLPAGGRRTANNGVCNVINSPGSSAYYWTSGKVLSLRYTAMSASPFDPQYTTPSFWGCSVRLMHVFSASK